MKRQKVKPKNAGAEVGPEEIAVYGQQAFRNLLEELEGVLGINRAAPTEEEIRCLCNTMFYVIGNAMTWSLRILGNEGVRYINATLAAVKAGVEHLEEEDTSIILPPGAASPSTQDEPSAPENKG